MIDRKHFDHICSLMIKAMLFFCVDFSLNSINVLPDWIGWICLIRIYDRLGEENAECRSFSHFALWLAWFSGIEWAFAMVAEVQHILIVDALSNVLTVWIVFRTLCILAEQAECRGVEHPKGMYLAANGFVLLRTGMSFLAWLPAQTMNLSVNDTWIAGAGILLALANVVHIAFGLSSLRYEAERLARETEV